MSDLRTPRYHQLYLALKERIADGSFPMGEILPGEHQLAAMFNVSRITSRRALSELERSGLVSREQGRGTRVISRIADAVVDSTATSLENSNRLIGSSQAVIKDMALVLPPPAARRALDLGGDERAWRIERLRFTEGVPFCHVTAFVPEPIGNTFSRQELERSMLVTLIERGGWRLGDARQSISATIADPVLAESLGIDVGAPLLRVMRTVVDTKGSPIEYVVMLFRPDLYQLDLILKRETGRGEEDSPIASGMFSISA